MKTAAGASGNKGTLLDDNSFETELNSVAKQKKMGNNNSGKTHGSINKPLSRGDSSRPSNSTHTIGNTNNKSRQVNGNGTNVARSTQVINSPTNKSALQVKSNRDGSITATNNSNNNSNRTGMAKGPISNTKDKNSPLNTSSRTTGPEKGQNPRDSDKKHVKFADDPNNKLNVKSKNQGKVDKLERIVGDLKKNKPEAGIEDNPHQEQEDEEEEGRDRGNQIKNVASTDGNKLEKQLVIDTNEPSPEIDIDATQLPDIDFSSNNNENEPDTQHIVEKGDENENFINGEEDNMKDGENNADDNNNNNIISDENAKDDHDSNSPPGDNNNENEKNDVTTTDKTNTKTSIDENENDNISENIDGTDDNDNNKDSKADEEAEEAEEANKTASVKPTKKIKNNSSKPKSTVSKDREKKKKQGTKRKRVNKNVKTSENGSSSKRRKLTKTSAKRSGKSQNTKSKKRRQKNKKDTSDLSSSSSNESASSSDSEKKKSTESPNRRTTQRKRKRQRDPLKSNIITGEIKAKKPAKKSASDPEGNISKTKLRIFNRNRIDIRDMDYTIFINKLAEPWIENKQIKVTSDIIMTFNNIINYVIRAFAEKINMCKQTDNTTQTVGARHVDCAATFFFPKNLKELFDSSVELAKIRWNKQLQLKRKKNGKGDEDKDIENDKDNKKKTKKSTGTDDDEENVTSDVTLDTPIQDIAGIILDINLVLVHLSRLIVTNFFKIVGMIVAIYLEGLLHQMLISTFSIADQRADNAFDPTVAKTLKIPMGRKQKKLLLDSSNNKEKCITKRDILMTVNSCPGMKSVLGNLTIAGAGVISNYDIESLLPGYSDDLSERPRKTRRISSDGSNKRVTKVKSENSGNANELIKVQASDNLVQDVKKQESNSLHKKSTKERTNVAKIETNSDAELMAMFGP